MLVDVLITTIVVIVLAGITQITANAYPKDIRRLIWFALAEYLVAATAQMLYSRVLVHGGDAYWYGKGGVELARTLDVSFDWASHELGALLLQRPSAFDDVVLGSGGNTGSMFAAAAFMAFFLRGSETAMQIVVAGAAMFGALNIYTACQETYPEIPRRRLFIAMVLFPSVAFWTSALLKEGFCLVGCGALFAAWRSARHSRFFRTVIYGVIGGFLILIFRAPALPPLLLGLVVYFVVDRIKRTRGADAGVLGPVYLTLGLLFLALGMVLVTRVAPDLALDRLGDSVAMKQKAWGVSGGGSTFDTDEPIALSPAQQVLRAPLALLNALFRPQLFDVSNALVLMSAVEMTAITWMVIRAFRMHGARGLVVRVQRSPFLLMCTVITLVGCTFVGLATLNFGSLARYRVPFLPFYGGLLAALTTRAGERAPAKTPVPLTRRERALALRRRPRRTTAPT